MHPEAARGHVRRPRGRRRQPSATSLSTASAASVTWGVTPSSRRSSAAASSSCTRRTEWARLPSSSRSTSAPSAAASVAATSARNHSSHPAARAAASPSSERRRQALHEHRAQELPCCGVLPGRPGSSSTCAPSGRRSSANRGCAGARSEQRNAKPAAGHGRHHRDVREQRARRLDGCRELVLQRRAAGVQVGEDRARPDGGGGLRDDLAGARGGDEAQHERGAVDRVRDPVSDTDPLRAARGIRVPRAQVAARAGEIAGDRRACLAEPDDRHALAAESAGSRKRAGGRLRGHGTAPESRERLDHNGHPGLRAKRKAHCASNRHRRRFAQEDGSNCVQ